MERICVKQHFKSDLPRMRLQFLQWCGYLTQRSWEISGWIWQTWLPETHSARLNISDRQVKFNVSHKILTPSLLLLRELKCQCYFFFSTPELWIPRLQTVSKVQLPSQLLAAVEWDWWISAAGQRMGLLPRLATITFLMGRYTVWGVEWAKRERTHALLTASRPMPLRTVMYFNILGDRGKKNITSRVDTVSQQVRADAEGNGKTFLHQKK